MTTEQRRTPHAVAALAAFLLGVTSAAAPSADAAVTLYAVSSSSFPVSLPRTLTAPTTALSISLWTDVSVASISYLMPQLLGDVPANSAEVTVWRDANANGVLDLPGDQQISTGNFFGAGGSVNMGDLPIGTATTTLFIGLRYANFPAGQEFRLAFIEPYQLMVYNAFVHPASFPLGTSTTTVHVRVPANPTDPAAPHIAARSTPFVGGGLDSGLVVQSGQIVRIVSSGTWKGGAGIGVISASGTATLGGLSGTMRLGALAARVGSGAWFQVGSSVSVTATGQGPVYLAINDLSTGDNSGAVNATLALLPSTVTKRWIGGTPGFETLASIDLNWAGGRPHRGESALFDASSYDCEWDLPALSLNGLTVTTAYHNAIILRPPQGAFNNFLRVSTHAVIAGGTFYQNYQTLEVEGRLIVKDSATYDMGGPEAAAATMSSFLKLGQGLFAQNHAILRARGVFANLSSLVPGTSWEFRVDASTLDFVNSSYGININGFSSITIGPGVTVAAFDEVSAYSFGTGQNSVVLRSTAPVNWVFRDMQIGGTTPPVVEASQLFAGSTVTFLNASGSGAGSPRAFDPGGRLRWLPDSGGVSASVAGTLLANMDGNYVVRLTTDPAGRASFVGQASVEVVSAGATAFGFSGTVQSPNTYYLFAFGGSSSYGDPDSLASRGGLGHRGEFRSEPLFVGSGANISGLTVEALGWGRVEGFVTNLSTQTGPILVEAWRGAPGAPTSTRTALGSGPFFSFETSSGTLNLVGFVDVNRNARFDPFEANGSSPLVTVPAFGSMPGRDFSISGGSTAPGGLLTVATASLHGGAIAFNFFTPMIALDLSASGGPAQLSALKVKYLSDDMAGSVIGQAVLDRNSDGEYQTPFVNAAGEPQGDDYLGYASLGGSNGSTGTIVFNEPLFVASGQTRRILLGLDPIVNSFSSASISVLSSDDFGLAAGAMAVQAIYPIHSGPAATRQKIPANVYASASGYLGGEFTGQPVYLGQSLSTAVIAGRWRTGPSDAWTGAGGYPGTEGQATVVPSARRGELIARVNEFSGTNSSAWFRLGGATLPVSVPYTGTLVLAINDFEGGYFDNEGGLYAKYGVGGSTTGSLAAEILYPDPVGGTLNVFARTSGAADRMLSTTITAATSYLLTFNDLPPAEYSIVADHAGNADFGVSGDAVLVSTGATASIRATMYKSTGGVTGTIMYSGVLSYGQFNIGVTTVTNLNGRVAFFGGSTQTLPGPFAVSELPTPATYYLVAYRDGDFDGRPDGTDPFGYFGAPGGSPATLSSYLTPIYVSTGGSSAIGSVTLVDYGALDGFVDLPPAATGQVVIAAGRGKLGAPGFVFESREAVPLYATAGAYQPYFEVPLLLPATNYSLFAFHDKNLNDAVDAGEASFTTPDDIPVPSGGRGRRNIDLTTVLPPPAPGAPRASTRPAGVEFGWNLSEGATVYFLRRGDATTFAQVFHPTTYYLAALTPNASAPIATIVASGPNGASSAASFPASVWSAPATPGTPSPGALTPVSAVVTWTANGNPAGTVYELYRSSAPGRPRARVYSGSATSFSDRGLVPGEDFEYAVRALNAAGQPSPESATAQTGVLGAQSGLKGQVSYFGAQSGSVIVEAFSDAGFTTLTASVTMPALSAQPWFLGPASGSHYIRARKDILGTGAFSAAADRSPAPGNPVAAPATGVNFTIAVDTVPPAPPAGVVANPGQKSLALAWVAPTKNADGSALTDLAGYEVHYSTAFGAPFQVAFTTGASATLTFPAPPGAAYPPVRAFVRARDFGLNLSSPTAIVEGVPSPGGSISGVVRNFAGAAAGQLRVRLSTTPAPSAPAVAEASVGSYTFSGLSDGDYFLRAFSDLNGNNAHEAYQEPGGTFGGLVSPFRVQIVNGNAVTRADATLCARQTLTPGTSVTVTLTAADCPALDKGPGYRTRLFAVPAGFAVSGSAVGLGSQVTVTAKAAFDTEVIVLGPNGAVIGRDNTPGGAGLTFTPTTTGTYLIEPTSFAGELGAITVSLRVDGGFAGAIVGTSNYSGARPGDIWVQLFDAANSNGAPLASSTRAAPGAYAFNGVRDGVYAVRAFKDANGNGIHDPGEPSGAFGPSVSQATPVSIFGGLASPAAPHPVNLADPPVGALAGAVIYRGSQPGGILIQAGVPPPYCPQCSEFDVPLGSTQVFASGSYALQFLSPATNYILRAFVDVNANKRADPLEPLYSTKTLVVTAGSTKTLSFVLDDPGVNTYPGPIVLQGTVAYAGAATGTIFVGYAQDPGFRRIDYLLQLPATGYFERPGVQGETTYYMAAFIDLNGNNNPDRDLGEPFAIGASTGFTGVPDETNPPGIRALNYGALGSSVTLQDAPNGEIRGAATYEGSAALSAPIVIEAYRMNEGEPRKTRVVRSGGTTVYDFALRFLPAATNYSLNAFVDLNGNDRYDFGEPGGFRSGVAVSSGAGAFPTYGQNITINDAGSFGTAGGGASLRLEATYLGIQSGPVFFRIFDNPSLSGVPVRTIRVDGPPGTGFFLADVDNLPPGVYYADAFRDPAGVGVYVPSLHARAVMEDGQGIDLNGYGYNYNAHAELTDVGAGGSVNLFTGSFAGLGGVRFDGGATDVSAVIAIDSFTANAPQVVVLGITDQNRGAETVLVRYSSAGVALATAAISAGNGVDILVVDNAGRVFRPGHDEDEGTSFYYSTGTITRLDPAFGGEVKQQFTGNKELSALDYSTATDRLYAAGRHISDPLAARVIRVNPTTLVAESFGDIALPNMCSQSFNCNVRVPALSVHPSGQHLFVYALVEDYGSGTQLHFIHKLDSALNVVASRDVTLLQYAREGMTLSATPDGGVIVSGVPEGESAATIHKFDSVLSPVTSTSFGQVRVKFQGGINNARVDQADGSLYATYESTGRGGDITVLRYDAALNLALRRDFDGFDGTLGDFPFSLAVYDSSRVFVTGAVNNGRNLDWITLRVNMNAPGSPVAPVAETAITTANAQSYAFATFAYAGTQATSGTIRSSVFELGSAVPLRRSTAPFGASASALFNNLGGGQYALKAFIDKDGDFRAGAGEPVAWPPAFFFTAGAASVTLPTADLCDRANAALGAELSGSLDATDCRAWERGGPRQDLYAFAGKRGQPLTAVMKAVGFYDSHLALFDPDGEKIFEDDDSAGSGDAMISGLVLPKTGLYTIAASGYPGASGAYQLRLSGSAGSLGSISGRVDYSGTQGGTIRVGAFRTTQFSTATQSAFAILASTREFAFGGLPTGTTYYLGAFVDVNSNGAPDTGEDGAVFGVAGTPSPVFLQEGQDFNGATIVIAPSTSSLASASYITGVASYTGTQNGRLVLELWSNASFTGSPVAVRVVPTGAGTFDVAVPGGRAYYLRAFLDSTPNFLPDPSEPRGVYGPRGEGAEVLFAPVGQTVVGVNIVLAEPGRSASGAIAGEGTAVVVSSTLVAGQPQTLIITYTAGPDGVSVGGQVGFTAPPGFPFPGPYSYGSSVTVTTNDGSVTIATPTYDGPSARVSVDAGKLDAGNTLTFEWSNFYGPCQLGASTVTVAAASDGTVSPKPLFSGSPVVAVAAGAAQVVFLEPPYFSLKAGPLSDPQRLETRDFCGNRVPVSSTKTVELRAKTYGAGGFVLDPEVGLTTSPAVSTASAISVEFATGRSSRTVYAVSASTGFRNLELFSNLQFESTYYFGFNAVPADALTGASLSTAPGGASASTATIALGAGGQPNQIFVNFTLGDPNQSWRVLFSSLPFKAGEPVTPVWERWGYGQPGPGEISWDGRYSPWINGGARLPNGLYYGRAEISGGGVYDDSLRATIALPQFSGRAFDSGVTPNPPLSGVKLRVYGPSGYFTAETDAAGAYALPGLGAGSYRLESFLTDYAAGVADMTLNSSGQATAFASRTAGLAVSSNSAAGLDLYLTKAPRLTVLPSMAVGSSTQSIDMWGSLQVRPSTGLAGDQAGVFSPMRLRAGTTVFDDGGQWDPATQQFVTRTQLVFNVPVGTYSVIADLFGFARSSAAVFVGSDGSFVALTPFQKKSEVTGQVFVNPNPNGASVSVVATAMSTASQTGGFASAYLPPGTTHAVYAVGGLDAGAYLLRANSQGLSAVTTGPILVPSSGAVAGVDFPVFGAGVSISGQITVGGGTPVGTPLYVNAWAPGSFNFGSTVVYTVAGDFANYALPGLDAGATYQLYVHIESQNEYDVPGGFPIKVSPPSTLNFTLTPASGVISGQIILPAGANNFTDVLLFGKTVASLKPEEVGKEFVEVSTSLPNFLCSDGSSGATGFCPAGISSATFKVQGLNTQTVEVRFLYRTTGQTTRQTVSVVNGSTTTAVADLSGATFTIRGSIANNISNALFNTTPKLLANAPFIAPSGFPAGLSSTTARVTAVRQEFDSFGAAISTAFNPLTSRVGYIADTGTFTITNLPSGAYFVRTVDLRACATCPILVPSVGRLVTVSAADVSSVTLTLSDGFSVTGRVTLDADVRDWGIFDLSVVNRRQEVVRSTTVYLGDQVSGVFSNSVDYAFDNLPAGEFYTLVVADRRATPKYAGAPLKFPNAALSPNGLQSALSAQNVTLKRAAYIVGRLKDALTGELIGKANATLLAPNFSITATANPWVEGGFVVAKASVAGRPIQDDGWFRVGPLVPDQSYDLRLAQSSWDPAFLAAGSQNYAPALIGGLRPTPGESRDAGVIALGQGQSITGVVRSSYTGVALGNIKVTARPTFGDRTSTVQTFTNGQGAYSLWVSSAMSAQFDITAAPRDGNLASNGTYYGQVSLRSVNLLSRTTADFYLEPLTTLVTGQVVVADAAQGGSLSYPFGDRRGFPAAAVNLQPVGTVPESNPLGDIETATDERGRFSLPGLATGTYSLHAASLGYSVYNATVAVSTGSFRIFTGSDTPSNLLPGGVITLARGAILTGRILKSDGSSPNTAEIRGVAAANFAAGEFVVGSVETNPISKTVASYSISGFKTGVVYDVVIISGESGKDVSFPVEGDDVSFSALESTATKTLNLTFKPARLDCLGTAKALDAARSQFRIDVECLKPLREETASDADLASILTVSTYTADGAAYASPNGTGALSGRALDATRRRLTAIYAPGASETRFGVRVRAASSEIDPTTGESFRIDKVFDFYAGLDSHADGRVTNANGGSVELPPSSQDELLGLEERSRILLQPGTFAQGSGSESESSVVASPTITVNVTMTKGRDQQLARALSVAARGYAPAALHLPDNPSSYPAETWAAMNAYRTQAGTDTVGGANPLSAFYSIFLPAGIRHQLKERADLTLSYSLLASSSTTPDKIQVWFYNAVTGRFELENSNRRVDTVNKTITVSVDHFSTFVVLDSTPVATSTVIFSGAEITAANFPNPSDCVTHSGITRNATLFGSGGVHAPFTGTMIRASLPSGDPAPYKINIYNVAGEKVRTIEQGTLPGSRTYYTPWNCANDAGRTVASGVYIAEIVHGSRRKYIKIAIIKGSGL